MYQDEKLPPSNYAIIRWFGFDQFIPEATVTSYWVSSKTFFIIRFITTLYSTIVIWTDIGITGPAMKYFFDMFTHLTFIGLHAYLVTSTVYHFRYLHSKSLDFYFNQFTILNYLYVYLYHTVITFNIVTPVVYWSILHGSATPGVSAWINTSVHGVSFFLMIFDVILGRQKVIIRMIVPVLFTVILYMCMTFIIHVTQGFWVYPFLDWSQGGRAAIWYVAVGLIVVASFFIQWLIHFVRDFVARKTGKQGHASQVDAQNKLETSLEEA